MLGLDGAWEVGSDLPRVDALIKSGACSTLFLKATPRSATGGPTKITTVFNDQPWQHKKPSIRCPKFTQLPNMRQELWLRAHAPVFAFFGGNRLAPGVRQPEGGGDFAPAEGRGGPQRLLPRDGGALFGGAAGQSSGSERQGERREHGLPCRDMGHRGAPTRAVRVPGAAANPYL